MVSSETNNDLRYKYDEEVNTDWPDFSAPNLDWFLVLKVSHKLVVFNSIINIKLNPPQHSNKCTVPHSLEG